MKTTIKKISLLVFLLAMTSRLALSQVEQGLSYRHPDGSIFLQFPVGWVQSSPTSPVQSAYFVYRQGRTPIAETIIFIEPLVQAVDAQIYAMGAEQNSLKTLASYQKSGERAISLNGQNGIWRQFSFNQTAQGTNQILACEEYYFVVGNAAYTFHFGTYPQFFNPMKIQFDQIIQSSRIVAVGPLPPMSTASQSTAYPLVSQTVPNPVMTPQAKIDLPPLSPQEGHIPSSLAGVALYPLKSYTDPHGKFSILVPASWMTIETASGMLSVSGTGYALTLEILPGPETAEAMQTVITHGKQIISQGDWSLTSLKGVETIFKDKDPSGIPVIEMLVVVKEKSMTFSFIAPENEYENSKKVREEIFNSLKLN
ncbi:MAG: hypothetical protein HYS07_05305 [Chlamydiae bacterium]|nr:hypothetical protein [Chlamydiota bacterium]MBI3278004.1 hypothetical protein [Chlamydiota bacterium]